ncbi:hypothetical protein BDW59DRAFT_155746 [Aspergillus cavernicola]|uniref:DUF7730 domain-containing protein n=1 Tax=Aspergillus cavernicola TaxID=176166 RepID=A0ABR4J4V6_9EURO
METDYPEPDVSIYSTDSETVCFDGSELDTLIPRRSSSFLSLPNEIRFIIYRYAFSSSSNWEELIRVTVERDHSISRFRIHLSKPSSSPGKLRYTRQPALHLPVALLRTNHQIYHEALPLLYSGIIFGFSSNPTSLTFLLDRFSETARGSIRYLHLYPAPLYVANGPLGNQLSWSVLCAQIARLSSLKRICVIYNRVEDLKLNSIESQRLKKSRNSKDKAISEPK